MHPRDYVTVVEESAAEDAYNDYIRVGDGRDGRLTAPAESGAYEVRYLLQENGRAVASAPLEVTAAETAVSGPESAVAGSTVMVNWTNAIHPRDYVTIVETDAPDDAYGDYDRVGGDNEANLQVPAAPGGYEIRYLLQKNGLSIASAPLMVTEARAGVSGPETAVAGSTVGVSWTNVIHPRDYVTIVKADAPAGSYNDYDRVGDGRDASLQVPAEPGDYELRYVLNEDDQTLAAAPLTVTAPETDVMGPESAVAGSTITVSWTNVIHPRDYVTIVKADAPAGSYNDYDRVGDGRDASLQVPAEPGDYELRYVLNENDQSLAAAPMTVTAAETSVSGPESIVAGSRATVEWTNTIHPRDKITIVAVDAPADEDGDYKRVGGANSNTLDAPGTPGAYEIRYLLNVSGEAIARALIDLTAPEVTVSAPESVAAGSRFEVSWSSTVHPRDKVAIVPAGAPADADNEYTRAGSGTSGSLEAPESPGDYEVRYLLNASGRSIARVPVRVE